MESQTDDVTADTNVSTEDPESVSEQYERDERTPNESVSDNEEDAQSVSDQMGFWSLAAPLGSLLLLISGMVIAFSGELTLEKLLLLVVALLLFVGFIVKFMIIQIDRVMGGLFLD